MAAMGAIIWLVLIALTSQFLAQFTKYPEISHVLFTKMLSVSLAAGAGITIMATTIAGLSVFFLSSDLRTILVAPVDWLDRFRAQFIRTAVMGSWAVLLVFTPILAAVGRQFHWPISFIATSLAGAISVIVLSVSIGVTLSLLMAHVGGAGRARTGMVLVSLAVIAGGWWLIKAGGIGTKLIGAGSGSAMAMASLLNTPTVSWAPTDWWARALMEAAENNNTLDWLAMSAVAGSAAIAFIIAAWAYCLWYQATLGRAHLNAVSQHSSQKVGRIYKVFEERIGTQWTALLHKDIVRLVRTSSDWSHWILAGAGYALFVSSIGALSLTEPEPIQRLLSQVVAVISLGVGALILSSLAVHILLPSISLEGPGVPTLRSSPIPLGLPVRVKFAWGAAVFLPVGVLLSVIAEKMLGAHGAWLWLSAAVSGSLSLGAIGLSLWFGVMYPQFDARSAGEVSGSSGATAFLLAAIGLIAGCLILITPYSLLLLNMDGHGALVVVKNAKYGARLAGFVAGALLPAMVGITALMRAEKIGLAARR